MTVTIGTFSTNALIAQPFGYEGDARTGLTARTFQISGLLTPAQWQALVTEYNNWRNLRILDQATKASGVVGTTVNLTITPANGLSVTSLPCWFVDPPSGDQAGAYVSTSATLVDAAQALQVVLREEEKSTQEGDAPTLFYTSATTGNSISNSATLPSSSGKSWIVRVTEYVQGRENAPSYAFTALGTTYVTGALVSHNTAQYSGYIVHGDPDDLLATYDAKIAITPVPDSVVMARPPEFRYENIVSGGVRVTRYPVTFTLLEVV
jgi:hypothetical protein